jgi:Tol biopolymer transport system component
MSAPRPTRLVLVALTGAALLLASDAGAGAAPLATTVRASVSSEGIQGNDMSGRFSRPALSGDGRIVAFDSVATNLVPHDSNRSADVFAHDLQTGKTVRVSVSTGGRQANDDSQSPVVDQRGRYIAFDSHANNLTRGDDNFVLDVFLRDTVARTTTLVSVATDGGVGNASSFGASISADGRYVAFVSDASNLVPNDDNGVRDVFVRDMVSGTTELESVASDGTQQNSDAAQPAISADGRMVAFPSFASNLVPNDTNDAFDVFAHDRVTGETVRASQTSDGTQGDAPSTYAAISGNGRYVAFGSDATNLVANDTNGDRDVFVHDLVTRRTRRVSVTASGGQADGQSVGPGVRGGLAWGPAINFDGTRVAFDSVATNLVPGDTDTCGPFYQFPPGVCPDVFVRDRTADTTVRVSLAFDGAQENDASTDPAMDSAGHAVAFFAPASNLVPGDTNVCIQYPTLGHCPDIFVRLVPSA